jgi:glucokinase
VGRTLVVGDVGGTNARLGLVRDGRLVDLELLRNADFPSFEALLGGYLARHPPGPHVAACLAVAAPITGDVVAWTNRSWHFSAQALTAAFGFEELVVLNDFEAVARGLPLLDAAATVSLGGPDGAPHGTRIVLGPGTGLGLAALVPIEGAWMVMPTEGGHAGLAPGGGRERAVLDHLAPGARLAAEPVLSGAGIARLHDAIRAVDGLEPVARAPEEISALGVAGVDPVCVETLDLFCRLLGRFAGDAALTLGARGGVWLSSGICAHLRPVLQSGGIRAAFEDKPTLPAYVAAIPTRLVLAPYPALLGAAAALGASSVLVTV